MSDVKFSTFVGILPKGDIVIELRKNDTVFAHIMMAPEDARSVADALTRCASLVKHGKREPGDEPA